MHSARLLVDRIGNSVRVVYQSVASATARVRAIWSLPLGESVDLPAQGDDPFAGASKAIKDEIDTLLESLLQGAGGTAEQKATRREAADAAHSAYYDPDMHSIDGRIALLNSMADGTPFTAVVETLTTHLTVALQTVSMPYQMATNAAVHTLVGSLMVGLSTVSRSDQTAAADDRRARMAKQLALHITKRFDTDSRGRQALRDSAYVWLKFYCEQPPSAPSALELMYQGLVVVWASFEVFATDLFALLLNTKPSLMDRVVKDDAAKRKIESKSLNYPQLLYDHDYNLSSCMGDILLAKLRLDDVYTIKDIYAALLDGAVEPSELLAREDLRLLEKRRHLISHRRGVVDQKFKDEFPSLDCEVGVKLVVKPADLARSMDVVLDTATAMLRAAKPLLKRSPILEV